MRPRSEDPGHVRHHSPLGGLNFSGRASFALPLISFAALLVLAALFVIDSPDSYWLSISYAWDLGHFVLFFFLTAALLRWRLTWWWASLLIPLAGLSELLQPHFGRTASFVDWGLDSAGILSASLLALGRRYAKPQWYRRAAVGCWALALLPLFVLSVLDFRQLTLFPVLSDFETPEQRWFWDAGNIEPLPNDQGYGLRLELQADVLFPGVRLRLPGNSWKNFESLSFKVFNPKEYTLPIRLRIHDQAHRRSTHQHRSDRFSRAYGLKPGWNAITVPIAEIEQGPRSRTLNLSQLIKLKIFYQGRLKQPTYIYLDEIRLN